MATLETTNTTQNGSRRKVIFGIFGSLAIVGLLAGLIYWRYSATRVYIEKAQVTAPLIPLSSTVAGTLQEVFVKVGDTVPADMVVARVGNNLVKANVPGVITTVSKDIGTLFAAGQSIITMIDPTELRIVGSLEEDKGLSDVQVGQTVYFTVDAYGSKKYYAVVDEVSPTSHESGVVFNISDQREVKQFDVKARFDISAYPELKNGMSARMWVLK